MNIIGAAKDKWNKIPLAAKVSVAYTICSILQRSISLITTPFFTRLLTKEEYGQSTVFSSWVSILQIFITLNLAYGSFSTAMVKYEDDREGYVSSIQGICLALAGIFLIIYLPFRRLWNRLFEFPTYMVFVMVAEIVFSTSFLLWIGIKRFEFKYKSVIAFTLISSVATPIASYILIILSQNKGYAKILGAAGVSIIMGMAFFAYNLSKGGKLINKEYWKYALGFNIPLLAYYLSQIIFNQSDRIMISHMVGTDKAAVYGIACSIALILSFVMNAINNSYVPWYYGKIKEGKEEENRTVSLGIAALMALLLLGLIWFSPEIVWVMGGEKYAEATMAILPVAASQLLLFYSQLFINVEFYYEEKRSLVWASIGAALANLVLNRIFIPWFGFIAAAYTTLVSYVLFAGCNYLAMKKILKERELEDKAYDYFGLLVILAAFTVVAIVGVLLYQSLLVRIVITATVVVIVAIKYKTLLQYLQPIFNKNKD